ncbi:MAG: hypothetical protein KDB48_10235 [Solirubrobacterales bacterium]|nr:hypothetical protein [Solirubrobacterales bacterium]HMT04002.1 SGNH hydrolase domain-containing protein [Solirubrobacterales bacterium]
MKLKGIAGIVTVLAAVLAFSATAAEARSYVPSFSAVKRDKGPVFREGCLIVGPQARSGQCYYGSRKSSKKVVIFGDSHALQWTPALIEVAKRRDWRLIALLRGNCTAALVNVDAYCDRWRRNSLKRIRKEKPGLIIVASNTGPNMTIRRGGRTLSRAAAERHLTRGMAKTLRTLKRTDADVTLMRDLAMSKNFLPSVCVSENRSRPGRCTFRAYRPPALSYDFKAARQVKGVTIIDPLVKICPQHTCKAVHGRYLKFRDRFHISATYSRLLDNWLASRLENPW